MLLLGEGEAEHLVAETAAVLEYVRSSAPRADTSAVLMPGEPEQQARLARRDGVPIDDSSDVSVRYPPFDRPLLP